MVKCELIEEGMAIEVRGDAGKILAELEELSVEIMKRIGNNYGFDPHAIRKKMNKEIKNGLNQMEEQA